MAVFATFNAMCMLWKRNDFNFEDVPPPEEIVLGGSDDNGTGTVEITEDDYSL
jgi:hypothetical protein